METQKQLPTKTERIRILAQYLGQAITTHPNFRPNSKESLNRKGYAKLTGDLLADIENETFGNWLSCSVELKPLGRISDEDAAEIWRIYTDNKFSNSLDVEISNGQMLVKEMFIEGESKYTHNSSRALHVYDSLRERGYALPYKNWSVKELEEFGIYKLT